MFEILTEQYPNVDWNALEVLPIMYLVRTDEYSVIEACWPTDIYPTMPTSDELKGWLNE
jgi:hypothetical protein